MQGICSLTQVGCNTRYVQRFHCVITSEVLLLEWFWKVNLFCWGHGDVSSHH